MSSRRQPEQKKSFVMYTDYGQHLALLSDEECGKLTKALFGYVSDGTIPAFSGAAAMAFSFIQAQIDRDAARWEDKRTKRAQAGQKGGTVSGQVRRKQNEANEANASQTKQNEANEAVTVTGNVTGTVTVTENVTGTIGESGRTADKPPPAPRHEYGENGWVKLTDAQHEKLLADLGAAELERIIRYLDESAQMTGNKNRWKDWNAVIRKAARERWGLSRERQDVKNQSRTEADYRTGGDFFDE